MIAGLFLKIPHAGDEAQKKEKRVMFERVDPKLRWPDLMAATLDHIIPIAQGGTHEPRNVQLAHFSCNVRKRASHQDVLLY
jgi:5-methylcytosine-specific restriction endonuclease McrA